MPTPSVVIDYRRLPDRFQRFEQLLVLQSPGWTLTYLPAAELEKPLKAGGQTILEPGAAVVWFTYPGLWHDLGRFHLANGEFTGLYANVLTPVVMNGLRWETTDLCLDIWLGVDGATELLDEEDLEEAVTRGWLDAETARRARTHAAELLARAAAGTWPPAHVHEWTLERVRARLAYSSPSST